MNDLEKNMVLYPKELYAVIVEPILQGVGGIRLYHPQYFIKLKPPCINYDILLIFEEIATRFGRIGTFLHLNIVKLLKHM